jgi:hypothetical protein
MSSLSRIRAWHLASGFLVDRGPASTPVVDTLARALPEGPFRELHDYVKLDAQGKVFGEFRVSTWSVDDELSVSAYAVLAGELRERTLRTFYSDARPDSQTETAVLTGLREVEDRETLDFLEKALSAENRRADDHAALLRREGEARVAAIPGAQDDPGLGKDYLRAQELLRHRVASYGDPLAAQLLRALGRFGVLGGAPGGATDAFVAACRHAAFDPTIKATKTKPKASAGNPAGLRELSETLELLRRSLLEHADGQARADATANAAAYRRAADLIARARDLLIIPA